MAIATRTGRLRHRLLPQHPIAIPEHLRIRSVHQLRHHLQTAIEIEHSTIPAYLTALYSIQEGSNPEASAIIHSVVMEEMLHLVLAANVLNAIGGHPVVNRPRLVPEYPTPLPHSDKSFQVHLAKFSPDTIDTFLRIELPTSPDTPPEFRGYSTIGQFYAAVEDGLKVLSAEDDIFTGDRAHQVTPEHYYGGGGEVIVVGGATKEAALESALLALHEIVGQGEGVMQSIFDGDHVLFGEEVELAHYFRFNEIAQQRRYKAGDTPSSGPTGRPLAVDYDKVHNMRPDPKMADYPVGSALYQRSREFNVAYTGLLNVLHDALNGRPGLLRSSIPRMYDLRYRATALMQMPLPDSDQMAGPSFELITD